MKLVTLWWKCTVSGISMREPSVCVPLWIEENVWFSMFSLLLLLLLLGFLFSVLHRKVAERHPQDRKWKRGKLWITKQHQERPAKWLQTSRPVAQREKEVMRGYVQNLLGNHQRPGNRVQPPRLVLLRRDPLEGRPGVYPDLQQGGNVGKQGKAATRRKNHQLRRSHGKIHEG